MSDRRGCNWRGANGLYIARKLGLTSGLQLILDAGDANSYSSGQKWLDISGNGHDFFRGADGSATATDPTFNGTAGRLSADEYFSSDGGDYLTYDAANEAWMQAQHKDNAQLTLAFWVYLADANAENFWNTVNVTANSATGVCFRTSGTGTLQFLAANGSGTAFALAQTGPAVVTSQWMFAAVSVDEPGDLVNWRMNGDIATDPGTYTSPSSGNADGVLKLGAFANGNTPMTNGNRMAMVFAWTRALSAGELAILFDSTRGRFGV